MWDQVGKLVVKKITYSTLFFQDDSTKFISISLKINEIDQAQAVILNIDMPNVDILLCINIMLVSYSVSYLTYAGIDMALVAAFKLLSYCALFAFASCFLWLFWQLLTYALWWTIVEPWLEPCDGRNLLLLNLS